MDDYIVDRARELVSGENTRFEDVIESLDISRKALDEKRQETEILKIQAETEKQKAIEYRESIDELREKELEKARGEALRIVENARRSAHALLFEIDELRKEKSKTNDAQELARRARQQIKKSLGELDEVTNPVFERFEDEDYVLPRPLKIGDKVFIKDMKCEGEVLSLPDKKDMLQVQAGIMKMRVSLSNLKLVQNNKQIQKGAKTIKPRENPDSFSAKTGKSECDLRGFNVEEGILEVDRFIDYSIRMGIGEVTIIHGKGTGVLRKGIQDYLRKNSFVKSFRLGTFGEGENGVTIVTLK